MRLEQDGYGHVTGNTSPEDAQDSDCAPGQDDSEEARDQGEEA